MKLFSKLIATSALVLAIAAPASAAVSQTLKIDVLSAAGEGSNVNVVIDGDTVTLTGYVENALDLAAIERAALTNGAEKVINNVFRTN